MTKNLNPLYLTEIHKAAMALGGAAGVGVTALAIKRSNNAAIKKYKKEHPNNGANITIIK